MTAPTYNELVALYPKLATTIPDEVTTIGSFLTTATDLVPDWWWSSADRVKRARLLLGAHFTILNLHRTHKHGGGGVGAVTGRTFEDGSTVSYSQVKGQAGEDVLLTTSYGQQYAQMRRTRVRRKVIVGGYRNRS